MAIPSACGHCGHCGNPIPGFASRCPHCANPVGYPNVLAAKDEEPDLLVLYDDALKDADGRGVRATVDDFQLAVDGSKAVFNRWPDDVQRLAGDDNQLYATYYQLAKLRLPKGDEWDKLRQIADATFFTNYHEEIRFAALTLDSIGITNYGNCSILLKDSMISHRAFGSRRL